MKKGLLICCFLGIVLAIVVCASFSFQPARVSSKVTGPVEQDKQEISVGAAELTSAPVSGTAANSINFLSETVSDTHPADALPDTLPEVSRPEIPSGANTNNQSSVPDALAGRPETANEKECHHAQYPRFLTDMESEELKALDWTERVGESIAVWVAVDDQTFRIVQKGKILWEVPCSSARKGTGFQMNSNKTPLGWHRVAEKHGKDAPWGTVFNNIQPTQRTWKSGEVSPEDLILTRVLVLDGIEQGKNKGGNVDSYTRGVYIHGTNDEKGIGTPTSHGCIRLRNDDVIEAFDRIPVETLVLITEKRIKEEPQACKGAPDTLDTLAAQYESKKPKEWGLWVSGVKQRFKCNSKQIALTLDTCAGKCDDEILSVLKEEQVPATLFIAGPWLDAHPDMLQELARNPLFEIENHGRMHRPLSVNGRAAYGIQGTKTPTEVIDEIEVNARRLKAATGYRPRFFRAGTAHCDELAVRIANALRTTVVNFSINGDEGGTLTNERLYAALTEKTSQGDIIIMHANRPRKGAAAALRKAIHKLRANGFQFVKIQDCGLDE
ncbi:MAG TPA: polysaccharide deacetylase family protein [Candidatus Hydrogenedentes bacterium]|nr:polysaccharide deacetylase family protein [Candidatus Hydrogenedentota bacterium]